MQYQVLGPVRVWAGERRVDLGGARQRALLSVLLLEPGQAVGVDRLVDAFWDDEPPATARNQVQIAVHRLRRAFESAGGDGDLVESRPGSYQLHVSPDQVDAWRFDALVDSGRELLRVGETRLARDRYREGLGLWRGDAFGDVESGLVAAAATRLGQRRLTTWEECLELELDLGGHQGVVDELAGLVAEHPMRERLRGLLMVALYRCGRQVEALAVFREGRQLLADQVGVEPGEALVDLHQRILRGDPDLAAADRSAARSVVAVSAGRFDTLPRAVADFTGRRAEVDQVVAALSDASGSAMPVVVLDGMAGAGKTALAVRVAHLLAGEAPDARLFIDLHGHSPGGAPMEPAAALTSLLRQIGIQGDRLPAGVEERAAVWRAELAGRRALVVLDNAFDAAQVTPLLPGGSRCMVLVTARRRLVGLDGAHAVSLDLLPSADAEELFATVVGQQRVAAERAATRAVVAACDRLPLAVRMAGSRLTHRPSWTIQYLADRLADAHRRLAELAHDGRGVAAAFALSYDQLTGTRQRMFRLFGHHVGAELDAHVAAAALDLPVAEAEHCLEELVDTHLATQPRPGRYRQHDLLRQYAHDLAADDPAEMRDELVARVVDYYVTAAHRAADVLHPQRHGCAIAPTYSAAVPAIADRDAARAWLETERPNLVAAVTIAADRGWRERVWWLVQPLWPFLQWTGAFDDWAATHQVALAAVAGWDNAEAHAILRNRLGNLLRTTGRLREAAAEQERALALHQADGDRRGEASARNNLAMTYKDLGRYAEAIAMLQRAVAVMREVGHVHQPLTETNLATVYNRLGWYREAVRCCEEALATEPYDYARALAQQTIGYAQSHLGDHESALRHLQEAVSVFRESGMFASLVSALSNLGLVHARLGRFDEAFDHHRRSVEMARRYGDLRGECQALKDAAVTSRAAARSAEAASYAREALLLAQRTGLRHDEAMIHDEIAHAIAGTDPAAAREHRRLANEIYAELDLGEVEQVAARLA